MGTASSMPLLPWTPPTRLQGCVLLPSLGPLLIKTFGRVAMLEMHELG